MEAGAAPTPKGRKSKKEAQDQLEQMEYAKLAPSDAAKKIKSMEKQMFDHARDLEFEQAAALRDKIDVLKSGPRCGRSGRYWRFLSGCLNTDIWPG